MSTHKEKIRAALARAALATEQSKDGVTAECVMACVSADRFHQKDCPNQPFATEQSGCEHPCSKCGGRDEVEAYCCRCSGATKQAKIEVARIVALIERHLAAYPADGSALHWKLTQLIEDIRNGEHLKDDCAPMPCSERYLSQRAVKAAEQTWGPVKLRKRTQGARR